MIKIQIENEIMIKKCAPDEFICKECMRINKKMYNLKNKNNRAIQTKGYVIHFGNGDFCLGNKFLTENTGWCNKNDRYFEAEFNNLSYLENFIVQEFELYHVII